MRRGNERSGVEIPGRRERIGGIGRAKPTFADGAGIPRGEGRFFYQRTRVQEAMRTIENQEFARTAAAFDGKKAGDSNSLFVDADGKRLPRQKTSKTRARGLCFVGGLRRFVD